MDHNSMETFFGLIKTPIDALIIFEACRQGLAARVHRRLSDIERQSVRSGSVYCFDEREAGMRRWTDGKSWSPSRVTGSFLTYRELDEAQGSYNGKYSYRQNGLLKQSFSITTVDNQKLHLISYYTADDVSSERLRNTPSSDPQLSKIVIPKGLYPETAVNNEQPVPIIQASPSPPMSHSLRQRPAVPRPVQQQNEEESRIPKVLAHPQPHHHHRRNDSASSSHSHSSGHRRTNSGSLSLKDHRYSPIQVPDGKHLGARSRSNSNLAVYSSMSPNGNLQEPRDRRYKSSSPAAMTLFPTPPSNAYSPAASWASDDDHPMTEDRANAALGTTSEAVPGLRELPPIHQGIKDQATEGSEQDSLSVLANLATHTMLLPKLEPKEVSRERVRWVEDDRQLRALSSMLRL
ncbi:Gti1/Pac2 family-domain-containing protein [Linnemannia elongata]|uniref:Gti1/Pac2 family-domain-containing protein n=1 Tax=Linnemannia elongata AG-77 TaxID=1314771 RepID=A0A197KDL3_9FUNG|nr:hypothetical protein BGZ88_012802 [Linnemannia elongata]KAG0059517.1 hypothetical protein BGZ89_000339 [Linnemannia elongata]KAH7047762.1 Gti1/Pac2 family-domain-containing protein [Linnemannia elongata]KAK5821723.1 Gti1/Pac2 family-domain-containing protein [Linnemannia elongata]OAQ34771.1 hypothetical protein K457DRAFT_711597 [Linnemannia elongata AG-77]